MFVESLLGKEEGQHAGAEAKVPLWAEGRICRAITVRLGSQTPGTKPALIICHAYFSPFECCTDKGWVGGKRRFQSKK